MIENFKTLIITNAIKLCPYQLK